MKPLPSRLKIALLSATISGVVLLAFGGVMWLLIYQVRIEAVDREIRSLGSRHPGLFAGRGSFERLASSLEFTYGEERVKEIVDKLDFPFLALNVRDTEWQEPVFAPYKIFDKGGVKVAVLDTEHFQTLAHFLFAHAVTPAGKSCPGRAIIGAMHGTRPQHTVPTKGG